MLGRELHRIEDAQHLIEVAPAGHRVDEHQLDLLVRTDHENRAHGGIVRRGAPRRGFSGFCRQHAVELGDLQLRVADHRIVHLVALCLFDIHRPLAVAARRVHA